MESNVKKEAEENSLLKRENDFLKKEVEELTIQLNNKTAHIEQLMESERNLKSELSKYERSISYRIHRTNTAAFNKLRKREEALGLPIFCRKGASRRGNMQIQLKDGGIFNSEGKQTEFFIVRNGCLIALRITPI